MRVPVPEVAGFVTLLVSVALPGCPNTGTRISAYGLDERPPNQTCSAPSRPVGDQRIVLEPVFSNYEFSAPTTMLQRPGDGSRWYVTEQSGIVRSFPSDDSGPATVFANISGRVRFQGEKGLLGMAFHPAFPTNDSVFLSYTAAVDGVLLSRISRFRSPDSGLSLDAGSEEILISLQQPYSNHNGGQIAFGPDGYLYISFGDGGLYSDPLGAGQDTDTLLGKILRIDVDVSPYGIPADNPFASGGGRPEVFAWGLRNMWRFTFDRLTGELWGGDVGQGDWEEVDRIELGGNYGWNILEGSRCYQAETCDRTGLISPVAEYSHADGKSITGGYVYRGSRNPELSGMYLYADFITGLIWGLDAEPVILAETDLKIPTFGEDAEGELYVIDYVDGRIFRIEAYRDPEPSVFPDTLSKTGCVDPLDPTQPAPGLIPYDVNVGFWSDGADKARWFAVPDGATIHVEDDGQWTLPAGSVVMKSFALDGRVFETRLLVRHRDGGWAGYTYEWNADGSDATLVPDGKPAVVDGQPWTFLARQQCRQCHTRVARFSLGLSTAQMNRRFQYPNGRLANQISTLNRIRLFDEILPLARTLDAYPGEQDPATLDIRARTYLHVNCSHCHQPGGPAQGHLDLRRVTPFDEMRLCGESPREGDLGLENPLLLAPGEPERSVLALRMRAQDDDRMPDVGSHKVDTDGVALIEGWIRSVRRCPDGV